MLRLKLEGGNELLLANPHGLRSLQCNFQNGGLSQPATAEHTYAVVPRGFLCNCQLDLEHASVLYQLSSCTHMNKTKHLTMEFVFNMGFYQLLYNRHPKLAEKVKNNLKKHSKMFDVQLFKTSARPWVRLTKMAGTRWRNLGKVDTVLPLSKGLSIIS